MTEVARADRSADACCPLCGCMDFRVVIDRADMPAMSNRYYDSREAAFAAVRGHLRIAECEACSFVYNSRFAPERVSYDDAYDGDQSYSPRFRAHMAEMAELAASRLPAAAAQMLEIGAGQGHFLELMLHAAQAPLRMVGYDPAWRSRPLPQGITMLPRPYDGPTDGERGVFDAVVARHVIEHAPAPTAFLRHASAALRPNGVIFVETPDLEWIVAARQPQDFFYEHCNYFTATTLAKAMADAGLHDVRCRKVFDGQYLWAEGVKPERPGASPRPAERGAVLDDSDVDTWGRPLTSAFEGPALALWGAGAKGVTLANMLDPAGLRIKCLIDVHPDKQGKFIGVSGHAIVSPSQAAAMEIKTIVVMNPNYLDEICAAACAAGINAHIVTS